jgi:hypothetical protein
LVANADHEGNRRIFNSAEVRFAQDDSIDGEQTATGVQLRKIRTCSESSAGRRFDDGLG